MKSCKFLPLIVVLASCHLQGMESKSQELFIPSSGRSIEHQLIDESKRALERDGIEVDTATAAQNPLQSMLVAQHVIRHEIKKLVDNIKRKYNLSQLSVVYDEEYKTDLKELMYDQLDPMSMDIIQIILSYLPELYELKGKCAYTIPSVNLNTSTAPIALLKSNGLLAIYGSDLESIDFIKPSTGEFVITMSLASKDDFIYSFIELGKNKLVIVSRAHEARTGKVSLYNLKTFKLINEVKVKHFFSELAKLSNHSFATARTNPFWENKIQIWEVVRQGKAQALQARQVITIPGIKEFSNLITLSQSKKLLVVNGTNKEQIYICNWETGEILCTIESQQRAASIFRLSSNIIASYYSDGCGVQQIKLWDCTTGQHVKTIHGYAVAKLPNNLLAVLDCGSFGLPPKSRINIIDPRTGEYLHQYPSEHKFLKINVLPNCLLVLSLLSEEAKFQIWR